MPQQDIPIPFPLRGVDKARPYARSGLDTTPYALNVFPMDSSESRARGGSRPGWTKRFSTQLAGSPRFLIAVSKVTSDFDEPYEYLVAGTDEAIYVSNALRVAGPPVSYTESLRDLSGAITDHSGANITDHNTENIESGSFVLANTEFGGTVTAYQGKVVFAQNGQVLASGSGYVNNGVLSSSLITDWTSIGFDAADHIISLVGTSGTAASGSYTALLIQSDEVILNNTSTGVGNVTYTVVAAPKILDPETQVATVITPTAGTIPTGAKVVTTYRDRLVWAVDRVWYMSRVGYPGDYDYSADVADASRAVAGVNSDAGQPGDPITAMVPIGYDFLVMFGEQSTWVLRGDPAFGGQLYNLSRQVGCVGPESWCYGPMGEIYFLSKNGVYVLDPTASNPPRSLSDERMPLELKARDGENYDVTLVYDIKDDAVAIFVTPKDGSTGSHWWFDTETASFWEFEFFDDDKQPIDGLSFSGSVTRQRSVTAIGIDGYIREIGGTTDDGDAIASKVVIGPVPMSETIGSDGLLSQLHFELGTESGTVTIETYTNDSAEAVVAAAIAGATVPFSRSISGGRSTTVRPRLRGAYACIVLTSTAQWSSEAMLATIASAGRNR